MNYKVILILVAVIIVYVALGGVVFHYLEQPNEDQAKADITNVINKFSERHTCITEEEIGKFLGALYEAFSNGTLAINGTTSVSNWDFESSIFFATTVITTIGYGNISPGTLGGRIFCVFFALIGIPLFLVAASGIGDKIRILGEKIRKKASCKSLEDKPKAQKALTTILVLFLGFFLMMVVPAIIFWAIEGWTYMESMYYTYITLTTIGFGDFVAGAETEGRNRTIYRLCVAGWIFLGLAWMAGLISTAQESFGDIANKAESKIKQDKNKDKQESGDADEETADRETDIDKKQNDLKV